MTIHELTRLVALGEGLHVEFKRRVPQPKRMAKEIIAFANTQGGHLLLGVDDDGTILGVRDAEEEEFSLRQALEAHCEPPIQLETERVAVTRKRDVIMVRVPASEVRPHFLVDAPAEGDVPADTTSHAVVAGHNGHREKGHGQNRRGRRGKKAKAVAPPRKRTAYVRVKDMSMEASREAVRLMRKTRVPQNVQFEFGDKELKLMRYLDRYGRITVDQFANFAQIPRRIASQTLVLLTSADVLAFHNDARQDFFTLAYG